MSATDNNINRDKTYRRRDAIRKLSELLGRPDRQSVISLIPPIDIFNRKSFDTQQAPEQAGQPTTPVQPQKSVTYQSPHPMTCLSPQPLTSEADPPESLLPGPPNRLPETALVTKKRILPPSHGKSKAVPTPETPQIVLLRETETPQQQQARLPPPLPLFLSNIQ